MMTVLQVNRLAKRYDGRFIFQDLTFSLGRNEKVGLVGRNGCGKSTLLKIIADREEPSGGRVRLFLPPGQLGFLPQEVLLPAQLTVQEYVAFAQKRESAPEGWALCKYRDQLGLGQEYDAKLTGSLSGGEKTRLCLALLMAQESGLLLLDEPTAHLDTRGLARLEKYLSSFRGAALIVSHDRYFLDQTVSRILEIDRGQLRSYPGAYSAYARIKEEESRAAWKAYTDYRKERRRLEGALQRKKQWARHAAAAASPRTPFLAARAKRVDRVVKSVERRLERLDDTAPQKPWEFRRLRVDLTAGGKTGSKLIEVTGVGHAFGERVILKNVSFTIFSGDKTVLVGPNGAGKTTLLRLIRGELKPDRGRIYLAPAARVGYMSQDHDTHDPALTPLQTVIAAGETDGAAARQLLGALLIRGEQVHQPAGSLSGGEKKRLELAVLLARRVNLLILDEPTNHLDIESREAIEAALDDFNGTILAVSHDRYFLHRLSTRVLALEGGTICDYPGPYGEYRQSREETRIDHREEILVLQNRLSFLSGRLDQLARDKSPAAAAERDEVNREFIAISRKLQQLK